MNTAQCARIFRRFSHALPKTSSVERAIIGSSERSALTSKSLVEYLDNYIIGQSEAKRSLAIAIIDRSRRLRIADEELKKAIIPSNILLLGPTGCGKTEVARKLAKKVDAPFVKVVATKYSEVGFVGEDTSSMIEELAEQAFQDESAALRAEVHAEAREAAIEEVITAVLSTKHALKKGIDREGAKSMIESGHMDNVQIELEERVLEYAINREKDTASTISSYASDEAADLPARSLLSRGSFRGGSPHRSLGFRPVWRSLTVCQALKILTDKSVGNLTRNREHELKERARKSVEEKGIIFIDEFDKMISEAGEESSSFNQKRRGVEKELLTLIEGTVVQTKKLGPISTDHVVFICAGAFSCVSPQQIMPELQGRLPIRCELKPLTEEDFINILQNVQFSLPTVQKELLRVDGVEVQFTECGLREIAKVAVAMNSDLVNTGARRLNTVMGIVMEDLKFNVENKVGETIVIHSQFVKERTQNLQKPTNPDELRRYIL